MAKGYRKVERAGKTFIVKGRFGNVHVYLGKQCLAFGIMTFDDAENWIWRSYPEGLTSIGGLLGPFLPDSDYAEPA